MRADWPELPGYELTELLGTGGMASVYLANQLALGRKVAIKVMSQQRQLSPQELARFEREARLLASLEHPHIVSVFEVGRTADGRLFYVMPHMPGGDLSQAGITGNEIAIAEVLDKILSALEYAHARGVIHRDLKPGNILFDALGQPRLADFGVARPLDSKATRLTSEGMVVGSASYMAPEQARGDSRWTGARISTAWASPPSSCSPDACPTAGRMRSRCSPSTSRRRSRSCRAVSGTGSLSCRRLSPRTPGTASRARPRCARRCARCAPRGEGAAPSSCGLPSGAWWPCWSRSPWPAWSG
ncbi:MAG: serine/threonine-protein kinase [Xanthomonadales bacterium]|nr:serine/threonine-protein kinase [Xanthomonadales bacterium]